MDVWVCVRVSRFLSLCIFLLVCLIDFFFFRFDAPPIVVVVARSLGPCLRSFLSSAFPLPRLLSLPSLIKDDVGEHATQLSERDGTEKKRKKGSEAHATAHVWGEGTKAFM
jgi:hypothetical protein